MNNATIKTAKALLFCMLAIGVTPVFAGTSASSGYFTVDTAKFVIDDVTSPYCNGAYNAGRKATFISGVECQIDFEVNVATPETRQLSHLIVNGSKVNSTAGFRMNVGGLNPGDKLEVVAVDKSGGKTDPFRVNIDVASGLPWTSGGNQFAVSKNKTRGNITYYLDSFSAFFWMDAISQLYEIANEEFPLNITPSFKVASTFESESAQYTTGLSIGASAGGVKEKLFDKIKKQPLCKFAGAQISGSLSGGPVSQWNPQALKWDDAGGTLNIAAEGRVDLISFRIPQTLYLVYVRTGLDAQGGFSASKINGEWSGEVGFDPLLGGHGTVGAGLQDALCVEGSASCGLFLKGQFPANPGYIKELGFDVKASWKTVFFGLERPHGMWEETFIWYPQSRTANISTRDIRMLAASSPQKATDGERRLVRRDYNNGTASRRLLSATADATLGDGYPYPAPSLAIGDTDFLVYLRDNAERDAINRTEVVCRMGSQGDYGLASAIWDDGTADFMPQVSQNTSGLAVVAWANAKASYDNSDFDALYSGMEIAVAVRNTLTGEWIAQNLTDDATLDMTPKVVVAEDGSAVVAWVKNQSNDAFGSADLPSSLYVSYYRNGVWSAPQQVETVGLLYSFDLAYDGSRTTIVYAKDKDGDGATVDDSEVWGVSLQQGSAAVAQRLSEEGVNSLRPFAWYSDSTLRTVFIQDDHLMCCDNLAAAIATNEAIPADYSVLKNADGSAIIVWRARKEGVAGDETCSLLIDKSGTLGNVPTVIVGGGDTFARNVSGGVAHDGSFHIAYECVSVAFDSDGIINYGDVELKSIYRDAAIDVGMTDGALAFDGEVEAGSSVNIVVTVSNFGTTVAEGAEVELWRGADNAENRRLIGTIVADIGAMSSVSLSFPWDVEQGLDELVFVAKVDSLQEINDVDRSNNTLAWRPEIQAGALQLRNASSVKTSDTMRHVSVKVYNGGILPYPAGATVRFWRGEIGATLLGSSTIGEILSGESGVCEVGYDWNLSAIPMTSAVERVVIELDADDIKSSLSVDIEGRVWNVLLETLGGQVSENMIKVIKGQPLGVLPTPTKSGSRFIGWYTMPDAGEELTAQTVITSDYTLYAHWEKFICRIVQPFETRPENGVAAIVVAGGSDDAPSSVKILLLYQTAAAADLDLANGAIDGVTPKGGLKFPLTLDWAEGEISEKVITIPVKADNAVEDDEFFTLQLAEPIGMELGDDRVCLVTIVDQNYKTLKAAVTPYKPKKGESVTTNNVTVVCLGGGFTAGSGEYTAGTKLTLTAESRPGWTFKGWALLSDSETILSTKQKWQVAVTSDETYVAIFEKMPYVLALADPAEGGTVAGSGYYAKGKLVKLKATASRGYVFVGWYDSSTCLSSLASYTYEMPEADKTLTAKFISAAEEAATISATVGGFSFDSETATTEANVTAGVYLEWAVAVDATTPVTVKVTGLPSGLKFTNKDILKKGSKTEVEVPANTIYGTPTAASKKDKAGAVVPSRVKITVTTAGKTTVVYAIALTVDPLPGWAVGTFYGALRQVDRDEQGAVIVDLNGERHDWYDIIGTVTIADNGKVSGKLKLPEGEVCSFTFPCISSISAGGFDISGEFVGFDSKLNVAIRVDYRSLTDLPDQQIGEMAVVLQEFQRKDGKVWVDCSEMTVATDDDAPLMQNIWTKSGMTLPPNINGKTASVEVDDLVYKFKFGKDGNVATSLYDADNDKKAIATGSAMLSIIDYKDQTWQCELCASLVIKKGDDGEAGIFDVEIPDDGEVTCTYRETIPVE